MNEKIKRLEELSTELFTLANSFAGDKHGTIACELHESSNCIQRSIRMLESGITPADNMRVVNIWMSRQFCNGAGLMDG